MLFIDKRNKIAPNIYIIDIGGYSFNVFEGRFLLCAIKNASSKKVFQDQYNTVKNLV
jgi:hypothetical protein